MIKNILAVILALICFAGISQNRPYKIVTTQISSGQSTGKEYIQMVVVGHKTCSESLGGDSIASLSFMRLYDHNGKLTYSQGGNTVPGIASGKYYFPNTPAFDSIPFGSVILVYNDANKNNKILFQDDSTASNSYNKGLVPFPLYVIPISWLNLVDNSTPTAPDSILQTPVGVTIGAKQVAYLTVPVDAPNYIDIPSYWKISSGNKNETPGYYGQTNMTDWVTGLGKVATNLLNVNFVISPNPKIPACEGSQFLFTATPSLKDSLTFKWFYNDSLDTPAQANIDSFLLYIGDTITLNVHTTLKCITGHKNEIIKGYRANNLFPNVGVLKLTAVPLPTALVDTFSLISDTSTKRDSSFYHMTFCKGTIASFTPFINGDSINKKIGFVDWYKNGVGFDAAVDSNGVFHDSLLTNHDTLTCYFTFGGHCAVNPLDTIRIVLTVLDSISPPNISIIGDSVICSSAKDNFFATFLPALIGDSTTRDSLTWMINGALAFSDSIIYKDGDTSKKIFTTSILNNGDQVQAILLTKKFNSCPYDTLISSKSNIITVQVNPSTTPLAKIIASQDGLCPLKKDTILFRVDTTNAFDGNKPIFKWYVNNVSVNDDSISYMNPALLNIGDTVSVQVRDTSDKCLTADSAVGVFPVVATSILTPNAVVSSSPIILCAGLTDSVIYTAQLIANYGFSPLGFWVKNGIDVTDTSHRLYYVYKNLSASDSIKFVLLSDVSCAAPKPDTFAVPITIHPVGTPSVSLSPVKDSACFGSSITVKASTLFAGTAPLFDWYLNNVLVASTTDSSYTFNNPNNGDSAFCHLHSNADCRTNNDTISNTVYFTLLPLPLVDPIIGSQTVCVNSIITLSDTTSKGIWSSTSPTTANIDSNGKVTGVNVGTTTILYTITDKYNCQNSASLPITVSVSSYTDITGQSVVCKNQTDQLTISVSGGKWGVSDSSVATVDNNGLVTTHKNGAVVISDTLTDPICGITVKSFNLNVGPPIVADIQGLNSICLIGWNTTLTDATPGGFWVSGDTTIASIDSITGIITSKKFGVDTIMYKVSNLCDTTTKSFLFTVGQPVVGPITGSSTVCNGYTDSLFNTAVGGVWSINNSFATINSAGVLKGITAGASIVTYSLTNTCGTTVSNFNINIIAAPARQSISGDSIICIGKTSQLIDVEPNGIWNSSDTLTATVDTLTGLVKGINNGQSLITYNVHNVCGTIRDSLNIIVGAPIIGSFSFNNPICVNHIDTISNNVLGATNLVWLSQSPNIADIDVSKGIVTGISGGTATITLIAKNKCPGGISSADTSLTVVALPSVPLIVGNDSICKGATTLFTNATGNGKWFSDNINVATVDTSTGLVSGISAGNATISYKVINSTGCDSTVKKQITVVDLPIVGSITGKLSICFGSTTNLSNTTVGGVWNIVDPSVATLVDNVNGIFVGAKGGKSTKVSYTVTNSTGCSNRVDTTLTVNAIPNVPPIIGVDSVCINSTVTLTDDSLGGVWTSSLPTVASVTNGVINGLSQGNTTIQYTISKNGCDSSVFANVKVKVNNVGDITGVSANGICLGASATLINITTGGIWTTISNGTITSITNAGLLTGNAVGLDSVKYAVSNNCGITVKAIGVIVGAPTVAAISGVDNVCVGNAIQLADATIGGSWNSDNLSVAKVDVNGNVTGVSSGKANIAYTVINTGGCSFTVHKSITVNALPTITNIVGNNVVCINNTETLSSTPASGTWTSINPAIATITNPVGVVNPVSIGQDSINYSYTDANGCNNSVGFHLTVAPLPVVAPITSDSLFVHVGLTLKLADATVGGVWIAQSPDIASATLDNGKGVVTGLKEGSSLITYKVTDINGCIDSSNTTVKVIYQLNDVYVPNFLYPNSSFVSNRTFKVLGKYIATINFKIYTQWGQLLYETSDINSSGWDGTYKGKQQPVGVYVYTANITLKNGDVLVKKGSVNLIR